MRQALIAGALRLRLRAALGFGVLLWVLESQKMLTWQEPFPQTQHFYVESPQSLKNHIELLFPTRPNQRPKQPNLSTRHKERINTLLMRLFDPDCTLSRFGRLDATENPFNLYKKSLGGGDTARFGGVVLKNLAWVKLACLWGF